MSVSISKMARNVVSMINSANVSNQGCQLLVMVKPQEHQHQVVEQLVKIKLLQMNLTRATKTPMNRMDLRNTTLKEITKESGETL